LSVGEALEPARSWGVVLMTVNALLLVLVLLAGVNSFFDPAFGAGQLSARQNISATGFTELQWTSVSVYATLAEKAAK